MSKQLSKEEVAEFFNRLLDESVKPFSDEIIEIWKQDGVAVVFFEVSPTVLSEAKASFGWDGESPVFRMPTKIARGVAEACKKMGDSITHRWLLAKRPGRIFAVVHEGGTFLINHDESGYSLEPNSTNAGWMS